MATITLTTLPSPHGDDRPATSAGPARARAPDPTLRHARAAITQAPSANAQSGVPFPEQPAIQLLDANGNPVDQSNLNVTATISAGGGAISGATTVQTDANGLATFTDLAISGANGARTLRFSTSGATPITAPVTIAAGTAAQIVPASATSQSGTAGTTVASVPQVQVRDASNNPVANHPVTFAITSGGGVTAPISGSTVNTDMRATRRSRPGRSARRPVTNAGPRPRPVLPAAPLPHRQRNARLVTAGLSSVARTGADNILADGVASSHDHRDAAPIITGTRFRGTDLSLDDAGSTSAITPVSANVERLGQAPFSVHHGRLDVTYTATATIRARS